MLGEMPCTNCQQSGHNKTTCKSKSIPLEPESNRTVLGTEDTGKRFEMAICMCYGISYDGKFKYDMDGLDPLVKRLSFLKTKMPSLIHTAKGGSLYDFTFGETHLSAKTTKKGGKVAPQYIGQATPSTFCERLGIPDMDVPKLKEYIQKNVVTLLPTFEHYTFSSPIVYWDSKKDTLRYITQILPIPWSTFDFSWTQPAETWKNSSTLKVGGISILEIQFHTTRKNMVIRWNFENVLAMFAQQIKTESF